MGTAVVFEYLDDTIRAADELQAIVSLPVLAVISRLGSRKDTYQEKLVMRTAPTSSPAEGYRTLRTNLLYGLDFEANTRLVITSARAKEGKSTTASNLAMALARAEHKTVLIDADFYRPQIHQIFELENTFGFSNLFKSQIRRDENLTVDALRHFLQPTDLENLRIITSGQTPSNPAELLGFPHAQSLCRSLEEHFGVTMIIFDTPPVMSVVDPVNLAQNVNASVLLVVMANSTRRADTMRVIERLEQVGTKVAGSVLNNVKRQAEGYYYYGYAPRPKPRKSI
jgi:capsular exopolysaccharide synthesis family protein